MRENEERWKQLCAQAAQEQDPKKLVIAISKPYESYCDATGRSTCLDQ